MQPCCLPSGHLWQSSEFWSPEPGAIATWINSSNSSWNTLQDYEESAWTMEVKRYWSKARYYYRGVNNFTEREVLTDVNGNISYVTKRWSTTEPTPVIETNPFSYTPERRSYSCGAGTGDNYMVLQIDSTTTYQVFHQVVKFAYQQRNSSPSTGSVTIDWVLNSLYMGCTATGASGTSASTSASYVKHQRTGNIDIPSVMSSCEVASVYAGKA